MNIHDMMVYPQECHLNKGMAVIFICIFWRLVSVHAKWKKRKLYTYKNLLVFWFLWYIGINCSRTKSHVILE